MVHVGSACGGAPIGIVFEELDVEAIEPPGRLDVEGTVADLLDRGNACKRQEHAEMIGKFGIGASDRIAAIQWPSQGRQSRHRWLRRTNVQAGALGLSATAYRKGRYQIRPIFGFTKR